PFSVVILRSLLRSPLLPYTTLFRSSLSLRPTIRQHWTKRSFADPAASIAFVPFLPPPTELRRQYLRRLTDETLDERSALQVATRSEEHTSELQSPDHLVCRLLLEKK